MARRSFVTGEGGYASPHPRPPSMGLYGLPAADVGLLVCFGGCGGASGDISSPVRRRGFGNCGTSVVPHYN